MENLNETKISNVVKENQQLREDQRKCLGIMDKLIAESRHIIQEDENFMKQSVGSNYYFRMSSSRKSRELGIPSNSALSERMEQLHSLVESIKTRKSIQDDENSFLRAEH